MSHLAKTETSPSDTPTRDEVILQILVGLQRMVRDSRAGFKAVARDQSLTYYQASALVLVFRRGGQVSMSEIADGLNMPPSTVTSIVDALVGRGLLARETATDDRRSVVASLSPAGTDLATAIVGRINQEFADRFAAVPDAELGPFLYVLATVNGPDAPSL